MAAVNLWLKRGEKNYSLANVYVTDGYKLSSVTEINNQDVDLFNHYHSLTEIIKMKYPGVTVSSYGVVIRRLNYFNGRGPALVVVDGVITPSSVLMEIVPSQIKSIDILNDFDPRIYDTTGGHGVVLIETKSAFD